MNHKIQLLELRKKILVQEAKSWLKTIERGGDNKGQIIELFQMAVDGKAHGEAWCMSLVQFCVKKTDDFIAGIFPEYQGKRAILYSSEHCRTVWIKSPSELRLELPEIGSIAVWQFGDTTAGHTGIVVAVDLQRGIFWTIEGNTSPGGNGIEREGDGVFLKKRYLTSSSSFRLLGFLSPWHLSSASFVSVSLH